MQHTDKDTDNTGNDIDHQEQSQAVILRPIRPTADEGDDCIILNADVHDEIEVVIEDAVMGQSVIIEATSVVEKSAVQASDIEEAVVVEPTPVVEAVEVAEVVEIAVPDEVANITPIEEVIETVEAVEVVQTVQTVEVAEAQVVEAVEVQVVEPEELSEEAFVKRVSTDEKAISDEIDVAQGVEHEVIQEEVIPPQPQRIEPEVIEVSHDIDHHDGVSEAVIVTERAEIAEVVTEAVDKTAEVVQSEVVQSELVQSDAVEVETQTQVVQNDETYSGHAVVMSAIDIKEPSRTVVNVEVVEEAHVNVIDIEVDDDPVADVKAIDIDVSDEDSQAQIVEAVTEADKGQVIDVNVGVINIDIDLDDEVNDKQAQDGEARMTYLHTHQSEPAIEAVVSAPPYPAETVTATTPTLDVSEDSIHKKMTLFPTSFAKPMLFLAGSSVLGIWVMQQSINAYFLQTYHKPSPLANIDNGVWKAGAKIHDGLVGIKNGTEDTSTQASAPTEPVQDQAEDAITLPVEVQAPQQSKEEMIKASLTLNSTQKVFFAGDSLMQGVAPHIQKHLQQFGVQSVNLSKQSTGLAYPKFFDWPTTIKDTITKDKDIKVLVVMLGPNDPWDMPVKGSAQYLKFQSPEWDKEYQSRMADILNFAKEQEVGVIWVTPPNMKKTKLDTQMMYINDVMMAELARHNVQIVDARPVLGSINNQYNDYVEQDGKKVKVRSGDGIHFTPNGQRVLAQHIQSYLTINP